jgi:pimeloyl-ACP methyl ester carboxylesterase
MHSMLRRERRSGRSCERGMRRPAAMAAGMIAASLLASSDATAEPPVRCEEVRFEVALAQGEPAEHELVAWLCARGAIHGKTLQVLIHGATFDHRYWDFPLQPETYSYVDYITRAGYAVLNVDRIGYGESTRPFDGLEVTLAAGAFTIHQAIEELRAGQRIVRGFGRVRADRVQLVGSSMGAFISKILASTYGGVDGVVLSSFAHHVGAGGIESFDLNIPAQQDPKFADLPNINYFSQVEGSREFLFYHLPNSDPDVIALDTAMRETWTVGEVESIIPTLEMPVGIEVPTLVVVGDFDNIVCNLPCSETGSLDFEAALYPPEACVEIEIIPDTGHAITLHENAQEVFALLQAWSDRRVGASTRAPAPAPCP